MAASTSGASVAPSIESEPVDVAATPYSLARAVYARRSEYVRPHRTKVKIGTWNIAACPGTDKDLARWFVEGEGIDGELGTLNLDGGHPGVEDDDRDNKDDDQKPRLIGGNRIGLYVLGLQEIVDLNLTREYMTRAVYTDNTATEKWQAALEAAMPAGYQMVMSEQMFGLLLLVYASPEIAPTISNISTKQIGTGIGGWFANKGAVATRLVLGETTRMVFVNCHLASGTTNANLDRRCADAKHIVSKTSFDPVVHAGVESDENEGIGDEDFAFWFGDLNYRLDGLPGDDIRRLLMLHTRGEYGSSDDKSAAPPEGEGVIVMRSSESDDDTTAQSSVHSRDESFDTQISLPDPDDFPEDPSQDPTSLQATLDSLLPHDQLKRVIKEHKAFHDGWREGPITFLPTYKYDIGTVGLFDSSEKQRAPSWCDRILFRTRKDKQDYEKKVLDQAIALKKDDEMKSRGIEEDDDVLFTYDPDEDGEDQSDQPPSKDSSDYEYDEYDENEDQAEEEVVTKEGFKDRIKLDIYTSHQGITSSDHKPIISLFTLDYDAVVPELRSIVHAEVAKQLDRAENEGRPGVTVIAEGGHGNDENALDFGEIQFLERKNCSLTIANTSGVSATFAFVEKPQATDENGEPKSASETWLSTSFSTPDITEESQPALGKTVTLEPGETVLAHITCHISTIPLLRSLNDGSANIEDVLVLRVEEGRDHFIPVRALWLPSCFGRSVDELIRVPDGGIRAFVRDQKIKGSISYEKEQRFSAPQELFKITAAMEDLAERCVADEAMLEDITLPKAAGWPFESSTWTCPKETLDSLVQTLILALDTGKPLLPALPIETPSPHKIEALSSTLTTFLSSLTDGIIPYHLWLKLSSTLPNLSNDPSEAKLAILDTLTQSPTHNIAFVFLTTALARIAGEFTPALPNDTPLPQRRLSFRRAVNHNKEAEAKKRRRAKEKKFAELLAPLVCRSSQDGKGSNDKATRERERWLVEACVRPDEG